MTNKSLQKAVGLAGGPSALARHLSITPQAVSDWLVRGQPPAKRVLAIEAATQGRVTRHELRPDLYPQDSIGVNDASA